MKRAMSPSPVSSWIIALLAVLLPVATCGNQKQLKVFYGVEDGCRLINCTDGKFCVVRNGTAKFGTRPFESFLFPKCVSNTNETNMNTEPDGNSHVEVNGPGCDLVQCAQGFQCQVRVSISKLGDLPYAESIGSFPSCLSAADNSTVGGSSSSVVVNGTGCELIGACTSEQQCVVAEGIAKYGFLPWSQFYWPMCA